MDEADQRLEHCEALLRELEKRHEQRFVDLEKNIQLRAENIRSAIESLRHWQDDHAIVLSTHVTEGRYSADHRSVTERLDRLQVQIDENRGSRQGAAYTAGLFFTVGGLIVAVAAAALHFLK